VLKSIRYKRISPERVKLPKRSMKGRYDDAAILRRMKFAEERY
jgi:polyphosphate kinase